MVFALPRTGGFSKSFALAAKFDLPLSNFREKSSPTLFPDQLIDVFDQLDWESDGCGFRQLPGHIFSVTYQYFGTLGST